MNSSLRHLGVRLIPWLVALVLGGSVVGLYLESRLNPVDLTQPIAIGSDGIARQGSSVVGRPGLDGNLNISLVTPKNAGQLVSGYIELDLPDTATMLDTGVSFISIQGTENLSSQWMDETTVVVNLSSIVPESYTSVLIKPAGGFQLGIIQRAERRLAGFNHTQSASIALALFLGLAAYSLWLGRPVLSRKVAQIADPPDGLRPIQLAILDHGSIRPSDLIAMLFDLAERGYLEIIQGPHGILFLRTNVQEDLADYERGLLAILFPEQHPSHLEDIMATLDRELFSAAVGQIYIEIYASFEQSGYFKENPRFTHLRFKLTAILLQFSGLFYAALGASLFSEFPLVLWLGFGLYAGGVALYKAGGRTIRFSATGKEYLNRCSGFLSYLASGEPIGQEGSQAVLLYELIPYALASGTGQEWLRRFRDRSSSIPQWYSSQEESIVEPLLFLKRINMTTRAISKVMVTLKDPNVE